MSLVSEDELDHAVPHVAPDHSLVVVAGRHSSAGAPHLETAHSQLVEGTADTAEVQFDHTECTRAVAVVVEFLVFCKNQDGRTVRQQAEEHMARLACHQEQHQQVHHFG